MTSVPVARTVVVPVPLVKVPSLLTLSAPEFWTPAPIAVMPVPVTVSAEPAPVTVTPPAASPATLAITSAVAVTLAPL